MKRKILKIGDSTGLTLPKGICDELGLKVGDPVYVNYDHQNKIIVVEFPRQRESSELIKEFVDALEQDEEGTKLSIAVELAKRGKR
jgi:antitoxin component of MazEF toxin-antitoxin module